MRTTELHFHKTEPLRVSGESWTSWPSSRLGRRYHALHFPRGQKSGEADGATGVWGDEVRSRYVAQQFRDPTDDEAYAGTPRTEAIRIMIAAALAESQPLVAADFSVAFLHTPMEGAEKTYVEMPWELRSDGGDDVWELQRALYGLRRAAQLCQAYLTKLILGLRIRAERRRVDDVHP